MWKWLGLAVSKKGSWFTEWFSSSVSKTSFKRAFGWLAEVAAFAAGGEILAGVFSGDAAEADKIESRLIMNSIIPHSVGKMLTADIRDPNSLSQAFAHASLALGDGDTMTTARALSYRAASDYILKAPYRDSLLYDPRTLKDKFASIGDFLKTEGITITDSENVEQDPSKALEALLDQLDLVNAPLSVRRSFDFVAHYFSLILQDAQGDDYHAGNNGLRLTPLNPGENRPLE